MYLLYQLKLQCTAHKGPTFDYLALIVHQWMIDSNIFILVTILFPYYYTKMAP